MLFTQGNLMRKRRDFGMKFHLASCIPQNEMVVFAEWAYRK